MKHFVLSANVDDIFVRTSE